MIAYQWLYRAMPVPKLSSEYTVECREGFFFGYFDKTPWSSSNMYLLAHRFNTHLACQGSMIWWSWVIFAMTGIDS